MARARRGGRGRPGRSTARDYPRTARLNQLYREIISEALTDLDEDWTHEVAITGVDVDADLRRARVFFDCAGGAAGDEAAQAHLEGVRHVLQRAVATEAHARRAPELVFAPDVGVRAGEHIDQLLAAQPDDDTVPGDSVSDDTDADDAGDDGQG